MQKLLPLIVLRGIMLGAEKTGAAAPLGQIQAKTVWGGGQIGRLKYLSIKVICKSSKK